MPAGARFGREAAIYLVGFVAVGAIQFVALPFYTRLLGPSEYGLFSLTTAVTTVLAGLMVVGGDVALARFWADAESAEDQRALASTWIAFLTVWSVVVAVVGCAVAPAVAAAARPGAALVPLLIVGVVALVPTQLSRMLAQVLRNTFRPVAFSAVLIVNALLDVGLGLLLGVGLGYGALGILLGIVIGETVGSLIRLFLVRRYLVLRFSFHLLPPLIRFGVPFIPGSLATWAFKGSDRLVLGTTVTPAELGHYALAVSLVAPFAMVTTALGQAWLPRIATVYVNDRPAAQRMTCRAIEWSVAGFGVLAVLAGALAPLVVTLVGGAEFAESATALPLLALASVLAGAGGFVATGMTLAKATGYIPLVTTAAAVLNVLLLLLLVPRFGLVGAAASVATAYFALALLSLGFADRVFPVPLNRPRLLAMVGALAAHAALCTIRPSGVWVSVSTAAALAALGLFSAASLERRRP